MHVHRWRGPGAPTVARSQSRGCAVLFVIAALCALSVMIFPPAWGSGLQGPGNLGIAAQTWIGRDANPSGSSGGAEASPKGTSNQTSSAIPRFIPVFTWNYQDPFPSEQESILAKYNFSDLGSFAYKDSQGINTWANLKSLNSAHQVYCYEGPMVTMNNQDSVVQYPPWDINSIARWDNARGHSMGNLDRDNPDLFLLDSKRDRIQHTVFKWWLLDVGNVKLWQYWVEAATTDKVGRPWKADGLYVDGPWFKLPSGITAAPVKYPTDAAWASGAVNYVLGLTSALHVKGMKAWFNVEPASTSLGKTSWITVDSSPNYPDVMMDEGAFVTSWGSSTLASFSDEAAVKNSLDTMQSVHNSRVAMSSLTAGLPGAAGIDNYGAPVTYWDAFYFGLSCFLLGKNTVDNNSYFSWHDKNTAVQWFDEFDINLGAAIGSYQAAHYGASSIYWRRYQNGYVYVNLSNANASGIVLPSPLRQVTHSNVTNPFSAPTINTLNLNAHRAAILVNSSVTGWQ